MFLVDQFAQVDQRIPHPSQRSVDADSGLLGDLFETEIEIVPEDDYFALFDGQVVDQVADILLDLVVDHLLFDVRVGQFFVVQEVVPGIVAGDVGRFFPAPEVVDHLVVRDAQHP